MNEGALNALVLLTATNQPLPAISELGYQPGCFDRGALSSMRPYLSLKPPCDLQNIFFFTEESATPTAQDPQARIEVLSCLLSFFHQLRHKWFIRA